jgi:hypothetical protein
MNDDLVFFPDESAALLREIFPNWPDQRGARPVPDLREFLERYRAERKSSRDRENHEATLGT